MRWCFTLVLISLGAEVILGETSDQGPCPNRCSGKGECVKGNCVCFPGWFGGDCSLRRCPMGYAWSDIATDHDNAHNLAECSNRGTCDRTKGQCICHQDYSGRACDVSLCPFNCWGNGRCVSMKTLATYKDKGFGPQYRYDQVWDAEKMYGCMCDDGYTGYDCSLRTCPTGDDPLTTGQEDEIQILQCDSEGGSFRLSFGRRESAMIPFDATYEEFVEIISAIQGIGRIQVSFSETGFPVCSDIVDQVVSITFLDRTGDLPALVVASTHIGDCLSAEASSFDLCGGSQVFIGTDGFGLLPSTGATRFSRASTREDLPCAGRGKCDTRTGTCSCYDNFVASNGHGDQGIFGDCGYPTTTIENCPGIISCSGHGVCSGEPSFQCTCSSGWTGGDCSERECPKGRSWFDMPIEDNRAHQLAECSNMGICDRVTGACVCQIGYTGAACERLTCPGTTSPCNGHGKCLSMSQLANHGTQGVEPLTYGSRPFLGATWDSEKVFGCLCDEGFQGYDCSERICPYGDDPETGHGDVDTQYHELQALRCTGDAGFIRLYFRGFTTALIPFDADVEDLGQALVDLDSIKDIQVSFSSGTQLCTSDGSNVASITFTQDFGDLPRIYAFHNTSGASLSHSSGVPLIQVASDGETLGAVTTRRGTRENLECSGRGTCDRYLGVCRCFKGFASSDGNGNKGFRGDCGWKVPWKIQQEEDSSSAIAFLSELL